jgi:hypothetical protein
MCGNFQYIGDLFFNMRILLTLLFSLLIRTYLQGKQIIAELRLDEVPKQISCASFNDSIYVSYVGMRNKKWTSVWVSEKGIRPANTIGKVLAIGSSGKKTYYYDLQSVGKSRNDFSLESYFTDENGSPVQSNEKISIERPIGFYVRGSILNVIKLSADGRGLTFAKIVGMEVVDEKKYTFPFRLNAYLADLRPPEIHIDDHPIYSLSGHGLLKIYVGDTMHVSVDHVDRNLPSANRTYVFTFLSEGKPVATTVIPAADYLCISTAIIDHTVFQTRVSRQEMGVVIKSLTRGKIIFDSLVSHNSVDENIPDRTKDGMLIPRVITMKDMLQSSSYATGLITVQKADSLYHIRMGTSQGGITGGGAVILPSGLGFVGLFGSVIATTALQSTQKATPDLSVKRSFSSGFALKSKRFIPGMTPPNELRKKIQAFEYGSINRGTVIKNQSYVRVNEDVVGVYLEMKSKKILFVKF